MAAVRSLGLHAPTGLPYLIAEGFLAEDPPTSAYAWETYDDGGFSEEVLFTDRCVVWSRGGVVKKTYSFDAENEGVKHAVLTWFPSDDVVHDLQQSDSAAAKGAEATQDGLNRPTLTRSALYGNRGLDQALVVFLNRQAHIHFLSGATHLVHLHFDVDRVFPAPQGLIIERQLGVDASLRPTTPLPPKAPPNSFFSPFVPRVGQVPPLQSGSKNTDTVGLNFDLLRKSDGAEKDTLPRHFCLTSPLAEVGLIVHNPQKHLSASLSQRHGNDDLTALGANEELLYVSKASELADADTDPLILAVTGNKDRQVYTVWQALYADSKSATTLFNGRPASASGAKTRRRSSFISRTGATTPAVRQEGVLTDLFTVKKRGKKQSMLNGSQSTAISEVGADDLLASQLDLDVEARHGTKASRRVSSMLSRAELSTNHDRSAFQELANNAHHRQSFGPHGRRGQSFGGPADRTSFGVSTQRRLRSSTPGAFSRLSLDDMSENGTIMNFGGDDTMMTDGIDDFDDIFSKHSELDSFDFRLPFDGLRREILFHRIKEIPMSEAMPLKYSFGSVSNISVRLSHSRKIGH